MQTLNLKLDLKALDKREFEGHGSVFGNVDLGGDVVMPGAFKKSLARHESEGLAPQMFWMHQPDQVPGKWLTMREDDTGLYVKGVLADTPLGNEMRTLLNMKAVRGLSIGFAIEDRKNDISYDTDEEGNSVRMIHKVDLWEVSLVSMAMNPLAQIEMSKARLSRDGEYVPTQRELEQRLRDVGISRSISRAMISRLHSAGLGGMPTDQRWDAGDNDEPDAAADLLALIQRSTASTLSDSLKY